MSQKEQTTNPQTTQITKTLESIDSRLAAIEAREKELAEKEQKQAELEANKNFNKGKPEHELNIKKGTITKVYSAAGLSIEGTDINTDTDTIVFIIGDECEDTKIKLQNLPKEGTNLAYFLGYDVSNFEEFKEKFADEINKGTGIEKIFVVEMLEQPKVTHTNIAPKEVEEVKQEEPEKEKVVVEKKVEAPKKEVKTPKSEEKQPEPKQPEAPKKPEEKKPEEKKPKQPKQPEAPKEEVLDFYEPLKGTLDEFGATVHETTPLSLSGQVYDRGLDEGDIVVLNAYAIHDNGSVYEKNVLCYYKAPKGGGRVRFTGYDGMVFLIKKGDNTLNQSVAAMRETLIRAHGANLEEIKFEQLVRYGDKVNNRISFIDPLAI